MWRKKRVEGFRDASEALENAKAALAEVRSEREDVQEVSSFHRHHRMNNHWSQRVDAFLRGNER